jgi:osmoprotectant transport system substrate-binding protein
VAATLAALCAVTIAGLGMAGCTAARHTAAPAPPRPPVVVASFNFPESELLAQIYAQALEHAGVPVRLELDLGPRELVLPALHQGLVDVVPEYLGSALAAVAPGAHLQGASAADEAQALGDALRSWHVAVLPSAPAQDQNGLAVTSQVADRDRLSTVSSLVPVAGSLTLGGPSECPTRPFCLAGLQSVYGLRFARFLPFDAEGQRVAALQQQVVDVAVMFTTDGQLATGKFRLLVDDRHLQPSENVSPLVSERAIGAYGVRVTATLDAISGKLTTADLVFLNWRTGVAGKSAAAEARGWLERHGLVPRS